MTAHLPVDGPDHKQVKSEYELPLETAWSEEHERVPLKQRLKMLRAKAVSESREEIFISAIPPIDDAVNKEDDLCDSLGFHSDHDSEARSGNESCEECQHGTESSSLQDRMLSKRLEVEYTDAQDDSVTQLPNCQLLPSSVDDIEICEDFLEDLDHVVLKERQRMLLSRELVRSIGPAMEYNLSDPSANLDDMFLQNAGIGSGGSDNCGIRSAIGGSEIFEKCDGNVYAFCEASESGPLNGITVGAPAWTYQHRGTTITESQNCKNVCGEAKSSSSGRSVINEKCLLSSSCKTVRTLALPPFPNVKVESLDDELQIPNKDALDNPCLGNQISVKSELLNSAENSEDIIDHMLLGDRMRLLASRKFPKTIFYENFENSRTFVPSGHDHRPTLSESLKPLMMKRSRKRRKTVTDSVETALEEDAPGLLQVLIEKGVLVDEIKLYGETKGDEALDESLIEESFSELEDVITKIFSQRQSLFKFAPIRCAKGEKASYCLACLISLVEQARYLRARKWPVEWGWCRDLQSFIFVFERHNRIVLERPEYGYATYFFELVDALPVHWQIKRLVTTMKLTSCSRITLIENRALMVGDDLTEGEARVLMEYGWIPDSGLGTMLNYRDRVVHDRKHESDSSDWRSKIGKLLTDGYNGGTIVPNDIPKKVTEYGVGHSPQIKLEQ